MSTTPDPDPEAFPALQPLDPHNRELADQVHPADWVNPIPEGRYNLVVIGAGTAGLVAAAGAAGMGAKVALIERGLMGGDCLTVGCVPSKALLAAARIAATVRGAHEFGVRVDGSTQVDFPAIMRRMRKLRADISPNDSAARFRDLGVDVFLGSAAFVGNDRVRVAGQTLVFQRALIATGARAARLPIPGWDEVQPLTNETVFSLTELPRRLTVIGGGPIGVELAQAMARFGSAVTLIEKGDRLLHRDDPQAAELVHDQLRRDGVQFRMRATVKRFERRGNEDITWIECEGSEQQLASDAILVSAGRTPNVQGMGLEQAGVQFDPQSGVKVDDRLRTTNPRIYAAGDVIGAMQFTHAADFMARTVIGNSLFNGRSKLSSLLVPWCTYSSPEVAHVGITAEQATQQRIKIDTFTQPLSDVDRAVLEGQSIGFVRVHVRQGTDKILGATVVAENAGDLISQLTTAIQHGLGLKKIASVIHPYPTQADAIRKLGDQYNRTRLTPWVRHLIDRWLRFSR
ncbi:mercuric reductase [Roseiconus nitratireducens]|uniref:Mercuric reductase n=1 Tax=Roseiconus nitratireducens TaxID=2605748 RepID=A0A5M6CWX6_9BACT|nr:mercuric reductase [Roseiconus nitratireducens]KAA5539724.1 mercuric reductase [Roseiconus nitratireducens]